MIRTQALPRLSSLGWLSPIALGAGIGLAVAVASRLGAWQMLEGTATTTLGTLHQKVGPVWVPMLLVSLRVLWISVRAGLTRFGPGGSGAPVRPELGALAPLFAALGLCGTVWGLIAAFGALAEGEFLSELPVLLGGLGAAMLSTLVGLGLQITTLLVAVINPAWSWVQVGWSNGEASYALSGRQLGHGPDGLQALLESLRSRQPEALGLSFADRTPEPLQAQVREELWKGLDSAIPIRVPRGAS